MKYYYLVYSILFALIFLQNSQGKIDLKMFFGVRHSNKKIFIIELLSRLAFVVLIVTLIREFTINGFQFNLVVIILQVLSLCLFFVSKKTMKESWATNIKKSNAKLVDTGVFAYSRNPVYIAYHLLFISTLFINYSIFTFVYINFIVVFHFLILEEEKFLINEFGEEYVMYCKRVRRYI